MKVTTKKKIFELKKNISDKTWNAVAGVVEPLFDSIGEKAHQNSLRRIEYIKNMSPQEVAQRYAKYLTNEMIKRREKSRYFHVCNQLGTYDDSKGEDRLLEELTHISSNLSKDKYLMSWRYHALHNVHTKESLELEHELIRLLRLELIKLEVSVDYEYFPDLNSENWRKRTDYQYSLVVRIP